MDKLVSVAEMREIEAEANQSGLSYAEMMENAGRGLAGLVDIAYSQSSGRKVLGLIGSGNNGGDTLIALRELARLGWQANAYLVRPRASDDELIQGLISAGGTIQSEDDEKILKKWLAETGVLLDGVLGTGITLPLKPEVAGVLKKVKRFLRQLTNPSPVVVAVDCPSGVDCETGETAEETLAADLTVSMAAVKMGLLAFPAYEYVGKIEVIDIGFSNKQPTWESTKNSVVKAADALKSLPPRALNSHKGTFGTALIVAGSTNFTGAAYLAGKAAYRTGAGLVTMAVPSVVHTALAGQIPEATWLLLPHEMGAIAEGAARIIRENLGKSTAMLLGPGWGQEETTFQFLSRLLDVGRSHKKAAIGFMAPEGTAEKEEEIHLPSLVIDADGLKLLAKIPDWHQKLPGQAVLTPHPGEMAILTGLTVGDIQKDRIGVARKYAMQWGHVVILKGAFTVVAGAEGEVSVIPVATPALARAGTGDVLSGIVTSLRAQGVAAYPAAVAGAWIHAQCGLAAEAELGTSASVLAGDVLNAIPKVFRDLKYR